jgi:ribonuclease BN (tRNA processing enzyme)
MKLTILGSGTGVPSAIRGGPGYLVQSDHLNLVMDLGMGTLAKLARLGVSLKHFGPILITHLHPDHIAELISLFFALKNLGIGRRETLQIFGCHGLIQLVEELQGVFGDWIRPGSYPLEIQEMGKETIDLQDIQITSIPVDHTDHSVGFRLRDRSGKVLAYSGDSDVCPGLTELVAGADLAVMECSFPDQKKCAGHLTPSEVGKAARKARAKKVLLTHLYPECEGIDLIGQCRAFYEGETYLAQDLVEYDI